MNNANGRLGRLYDAPIVEEDFALRGPEGTFRARMYRPTDGAPRRALVLAHGVHWRGIDERRLVPFARHLARTGLVVVTPELQALADYRIQASSVEEIVATVQHTARSRWVAPGGVGLLGLSFAGGLALRAAASPACATEVAFVLSLGGHDDLERVSHFLATDELLTPRGTVHLRAHDYGLVVLVYAYAERFVPGAEVGPFREAVRAFLHEDRRTAERLGATLPAASGEVFQRILAHDRAALGPRVARELASLRGVMEAASPRGHLRGLRAPVYLLHGDHDDVIPPSESEFAALELGRQVPTHLLVTSAISHVSVERRPTARQQWAMLHFMAGVLGE
jgi:pimeloyl-ACP methyl ester carboxylesterase